MGKNRNRLRRRRRDARERELTPSTVPAIEIEQSFPYENATPVLRLVRSADEGLSPEPVSGGRPGTPINPVREEGRSSSGGEAPAGTGILVAAAAAPAVTPEPIRLRRSFDAAEINAIINDPSVLPNVALPGMDSIDMAPVIADGRNIFLMADGGVIVFCWCEPGTYEVHTNFLKPERGAHSQRGPYIQNACLAAYRWMFVHTDCLVLLTRIPAFNRAAAIFAPLLGWVRQFERKAVWPTNDGPVDVSFWSLFYNDWVRKTPDLMATGRAFHARLDQEFVRHGVTEPQHADEDCHDLHVGACAEMIFGGQIEKAVSLYNVWARFSGYGQIGLVSREPAVLDIGNALLQIGDGNFKVILVK